MIGPVYFSRYSAALDMGTHCIHCRQRVWLTWDIRYGEIPHEATTECGGEGEGICCYLAEHCPACDRDVASPYDLDENGHCAACRAKGNDA